MGGGCLYGVCGVNGVLYMAHTGYRACTEVLAFHDGGVQLKVTFGGDGRSDSGIEQRIAFEVADDGFDGLGAVAACIQYAAADVEGCVYGGVVAACYLGVVGLVAHFSGTAVYDDDVFFIGSGRIAAPCRKECDGCH